MPHPRIFPPLAEENIHAVILTMNNNGVTDPDLSRRVERGWGRIEWMVNMVPWTSLLGPLI